MSETNREMPNLTWYAMCVYMKSELTVVGSCSAFVFEGYPPMHWTAFEPTL